MREARSHVPVALVVGVLLTALHLALRADPSRPNFEFFPDMAVSPAAEPFDADALLPGGTTLQAPVEGVVVRGSRAFPFGAGAEEAKRAGAELVSPFHADDAEALARGEQVYRNFCIVCHDARGDGKGTVVSRGMLPPPSLAGARALEIADGEMFHILTRGQGNMPSYAAQISVEDRWRVIAHVRRMQQGAAR